MKRKVLSDENLEQKSVAQKKSSSLSSIIGLSEDEKDIPRQSDSISSIITKDIPKPDEHTPRDHKSFDPYLNSKPPVLSVPPISSKLAIPGNAFQFKPRDVTPRRWSSDEDDRLIQAVKMFGEVDWKINSDFVGTRDNVQCRQRWQKVLRPGLQKGKWSKEEDNMLCELIVKLGEDWASISSSIPGRSSKQCRERWHHHLSPAVNSAVMTPEEDAFLLSLHDKYGNSWSRIAREMPGRTENLVRSRVNMLLRKKQELPSHLIKPVPISTIEGPSSTKPRDIDQHHPVQQQVNNNIGTFPPHFQPGIFTNPTALPQVPMSAMYKNIAQQQWLQQQIMQYQHHLTGMQLPLKLSLPEKDLNISKSDNHTNVKEVTPRSPIPKLTSTKESVITPAEPLKVESPPQQHISYPSLYLNNWPMPSIPIQALYPYMAYPFSGSFPPSETLPHSNVSNGTSEPPLHVLLPPESYWGIPAFAPPNASFSNGRGQMYSSSTSKETEKSAPTATAPTSTSAGHFLNFLSHAASLQSD